MDICNDAIVNRRDEEETKEKIKGALGFFAVSFQNTLANKYTNQISELKQAATIFYPDYKGLFRFSKACTTLMRNILFSYKKFLLNEDILAQLIYSKMANSNEPFDKYDHFQKTLLDHLVSVVELRRIKNAQKDVDNLLELVEIVYSSHIELSAKEWRRLAKSNRKVTLQPYSVIKTITGDLREAERCFVTIMSHESCMRYAELVQAIEMANQNDD